MNGTTRQHALSIATGILMGVTLAAGPGTAEDSPTSGPEHLYREPHYTGTVVYIDNDSFMSPSTDQDYTMGVQFTVSGSWVKDHHFNAPLAVLDHLTGFSRLHGRAFEKTDQESEPSLRKGVYESNSLQIGITAFTPRKGGAHECGFNGCVLAMTEPIYNDRPYASLVFATVQRTTAVGRSAFTSELTLGVLGLGIARVGQTFIHKNISHDVRPGGWDNQISDGGEPTLRYGTTWRMLLLAQSTGRGTETRHAAVPFHDPPRGLDITVDGQSNPGFYTNIPAVVPLGCGARQ